MNRVVKLLAPILLSFCAFILLLSFSLKNTQVVDLHYYLGARWHVPLYLTILGALFTGVIIGLVTCIPLILQQRKRLSKQTLQSRQ